MYNSQLDFIHHQYRGFMNTPLLEFPGDLIKYPSFLIDESVPAESIRLGDYAKYARLRLGRQMEFLFLENMRRSDRYSILTHSLQVKDGKITKGELDFVIKDNTSGIYTHVELATKFYLYDPHNSVDPYENYIGPMRRDTLMEKLKKFNTHQFPMLQEQQVIEALEIMGVDSAQVAQAHCLKAQLFLPVAMRGELLPGFENTAIAGYYCTQEELIDNTAFGQVTAGATFHIPPKKEWIVDPHTAVGWITYQEAIAYVQEKHREEYTPMLWRQSASGELSTFFCVCW